MTIAEQLEARGKAKGLRHTASNLLKEGTDPQFVAKVTGLSMADVEELNKRFLKES